MSKPVRILQLISSLEVGGAEKLLLSLVEAAQHDARAEFTVVVMNEDVNPELQGRLDRLDCPVYYLNRPESHRHPRYLATLLNIIRKHKIQVVHAHNYGSKLWGVLCKMSQPSLRLVMTVHDTGIISGLNGFHHWLHGNVIDLNIAISRAVERECRRHGIRNVAQIYNGIPVAAFRPTAEKPRREKFSLINVARMDARKKGQDVLLRALRLCRIQGLDFHCRLVGGVYAYNRESFEQLRQLCDSLALSDRVEFLTNRTDVAELLHASDLFVLPSRFEGLGLVVLEAMAAGLPVIASDIDGPAELVRHGENGLLFRAEQESELADRILQLAQAPGERARLGKNAAQFVAQFDIHRMKERYLAAYYGVQSREPAPLGASLESQEVRP